MAGTVTPQHLLYDRNALFAGGLRPHLWCLPVLKHHSFGLGVNVTLGLPFIRTSVDHGTALDLAGKPVTDQTAADPGSLYAAVTLASQLAERSAA